MRIAIVHQHFPPDTPLYGAVLRELALHLGRQGHDVVVLTCQPSYAGSAGLEGSRTEHLAPGVEVRRWPSLREQRRLGPARVANLVLLAVRIVGARRQLAGVDVVMSASTPPVVEAAAALVLARRCGAAFVYHKQDIHPEVAASTALGRSGLAPLVRALDTAVDRRADRIVVLSEDMLETELGRGVERSKISIINNFDPWPEPAPATDDGPRHRPGGLRVVFAGNLGRFQGLDAVLDSAELLAGRDDIAFDFVGDGARRAHLERESERRGLGNVTFSGFRPAPEVARLTAQPGTVGVVSVAPGVVRGAYPSKTMSYLRSGCPVIALVEDRCELSRTLVGSGAGLQVAPGDGAGLARAVATLAADPARLAAMGASARALYESSFSKVARLRDWSALFAPPPPPERSPAPHADVDVRAVTTGDAAALAALHGGAFPGFFLTSLGGRFLEVFYAALLDEPWAYGVGAFAGGRCVGFAVGGAARPGFYRALARRHARALLRAAAPHLLRRPGAGLGILRSVRSPGYVLEPGDAALLSICTDPVMRGRGLGRRLLDGFEAAAGGDGARRVVLSTDAVDNGGVNAFYQRAGYALASRCDRGGRAMNHYRKHVVVPVSPPARTA